MHAYLFIGSITSTSEAVNSFIKKNSLDLFDFPLKKITETKDLASFLKIAPLKPTAVVLKSFEEVSIEAQNALLKLLEEPGRNITFLLCSTQEHAILPTILSRASIIRVTDSAKVSQKYEKEVANFLSSTVQGRFAKLSKITAREDAKAFLETIISSKTVANLNTRALANKCYQAIDANGNVQLQLASFALAIL